MKRPNVLFIPIDDLQPQLHCCGQRQTSTPHINRLAESGTVFTRRYCHLPHPLSTWFSGALLCHKS